MVIKGNLRDRRDEARGTLPRTRIPGILNVTFVMIFDLKEEGQFGAIAVLGLFMLAMTCAVVVLMRTVLDRDSLGARE